MQPTMDGQDAAKPGMVVEAPVEKKRGGPVLNGENNLASEAAVQGMSQVDDEAVRAQIKELSAFFRRSYHLLYGQALGLVASPEVAEDVVQEAFTNTSERIEAGTRIENMNSWLRCCVQNIAIKHLRRKPTLPLQEELEIGGYTLPADLAHTRQRFADVCRAIDRLAPAQKSAFILAEIRGMAHRDIADAMDRSEGSVRQLISRARNRIREVNGRRELSAALPLLITADAEARGRISLSARAKTVRSRLLTGLTGAQSFLRQPLRAVGKPVRIAAVLAGSSAMVIVLGGSPTEDAVLTGSVDRGSSSASTLSSEATAGPAESGQDESTLSSSSIPAANGTAMNSPAVSNKADGSSVNDPLDQSPDMHSDGTYGPGIIDFSLAESQDNSNNDAKESVATIASPTDDRLKKSVVESTEPPEPPEPPVLPDAPQLINPAVLSGTPHVGETVSCTGDSWSNEPDTVLKRWRSEGVSMPGKTGDTYTLTEQDATKRIDCYVTAENAGGVGVAVTDTIVVLGAPVIVTPPTITGGTYVGDVVRCTGDSYSGDPGTATYDWKLNGESLGINRQALYLFGVFANSKIECVVTATNVVGSDTATSESIFVTL